MIGTFALTWGESSIVSISSETDGIYLPVHMDHASQAASVRIANAITQTHIDERLFDELTHLYSEGRMHPSDIAKSLGGAWTAADVLHELEQRNVVEVEGAYRLDETQNAQIETLLTTVMADGSWRDYETDDWIRREVIASQRIEGIDSRGHLDAL